MRHIGSRLSVFPLSVFLLACGGLMNGDEAAVPAVEPLPVAALVPVSTLWEVVPDPDAVPAPLRAFASVKAGSTQGLIVDMTLALVGPAPAAGGPQPVVGSARVSEVTADSARLIPVRLVDELPPTMAARALAVDDQTALAAIPEVKPGRRLGARPGLLGASGPGSAELYIPADLKSGSADSREEALVRHEGDPELTAAIVWVMKNDENEGVRFKAWRVVRARWKKEIGTASEHEAAAAWLAGNGSKDARTEAIAEIGDRSRNVERAGAQIDDGDPDIRLAAVKAVYEVGDRTGRRDKARDVLKERRAKESSSAVRSRIDALVAKL